VTAPARLRRAGGPALARQPRDDHPAGSPGVPAPAV